MDHRSSAVVGYGLCFLILFPPLAFGAVYPWAFSIMELVSFSLLMVWLIASQPRIDGTRLEARSSKPAFRLPFGLFIGLILFQMVPMPSAILRTISPQTYALYCQTLDGYGSHARSQKSEVSIHKMQDGGKGHVGLPIEQSGGPSETEEAKQYNLEKTRLGSVFYNWRSLSVYPHATKTGLLKILAYASVFWLIMVWIDDRSKLLRLLYLMILAGTLVSVTGMVQRFLGAEKIFGFWEPYFKTDQSFFGPYVNPNHFAGYVALIIPIAVTLLIRQIERIGSGRLWTSGDYFRRFNEEGFHLALFLVLALVLLVSGLFVSLSRGGILAFAGSTILLVGILSLKGGWHWRVGLGLMIGLFVALFLFWLGFVPFKAEMKTLANLLQDSNVQNRLQIWMDSWKMLMDFPLFGTGLGTFAHIYPKYQTIVSQATVVYPESDFFQILVETGFVGFGILSWFFVAVLRALWIRWSSHENYVARINPKVMAGLAAGMVALLIHGIGDFNLHIPANALQFAIVMGLAMQVKAEKMMRGRSVD